MPRALLTHRPQTLEQVRAVLDGSDAVEFVVADRQAAYGFASQALAQFRYQLLGKRDCEFITHSLGRVTGPACLDNSASATPMLRS